MKKEAIVLVVNKKSAPSSSFAVFETINSWATLKEIKVIPNGHYFAVLVVNGNPDIRPDLFVQGYRPHSSCRVIHTDRRRYGEFVRNARPEFKDDVIFYDSQLYQIKGDLEVELILKSGESQNADEMQKLAQRICNDHGYIQLEPLETYEYACPVSVGYFLAGRKYHIRATLVGKVNELSMEKKLLIFEYETGIPALVEYQSDCLTR